MADEARPLQTILDTVLEDGQFEGISAKDLREIVLSAVNPRGGLYVADGDDALTSIPSVDTPVRVAGTTTASPNQRDFSMPGNNRLQYDGAIARPVFVICTVSMQASSNNTSFAFYLAVNGTPVTGRSQQELLFQNANELKAVAVHSVLHLQPEDEIGFFVENLTDDSDVRADEMVMNAIGFLG